MHDKTAKLSDAQYRLLVLLLDGSLEREWKIEGMITLLLIREWQRQERN